jgi:alcohol dehydrogenase (cytochrome c)
MNFVNSAFLFVLSAMIAIAMPGVMLAQGVDEQMLVHPPADSWPGYHGDYSGRRHSALTQITPQNVKNLTLAWAFQTEQLLQIKSSPLLVDGILYFTVPENIWAVDARSGHPIWHYTHPRGPGEHIGHRGVAMYKGYLFFLSSVSHVVSINAKDAYVR